MSEISTDIAKYKKITCRRRDTLSFWLDWVTVQDGSDIDLEGFGFLMQVKYNLSGNLALELSIENSRISISGKRTTFIVPNSGMDIPAGQYSYDLQVTYPSGTVRTWLYGIFVVKNDVSE